MQVISISTHTRKTGRSFRTRSLAKKKTIVKRSSHMELYLYCGFLYKDVDMPPVRSLNVSTCRFLMLVES